MWTDDETEGPTEGFGTPAGFRWMELGEGVLTAEFEVDLKKD